MTGFSVKARHRARRAAVQALYQWKFTSSDLSAIEVEFLVQDEYAKIDKDYFHELLHQVPAVLNELDAQLTPVLDRDISKLNHVELMVMRIACYEFLYRPEIPYRVVINEALELNKRYGTDQGYRYVNGVLDKIAQTTRAVEVQGQ